MTNKITRGAGVYKIQCIATSDTYIGSSVNVSSRLDGHRLDLRKSSHYNTRMQALWNEHGPDRFEFEVLEEVHVTSELRLREEYFIKTLAPTLNSQRKTGAPVCPVRSPLPSGFLTMHEAAMMAELSHDAIRNALVEMYQAKILIDEFFSYYEGIGYVINASWLSGWLAGRVRRLHARRGRPSSRTESQLQVRRDRDKKLLDERNL